jgi:hypothetical protein
MPQDTHTSTISDFGIKPRFKSTSANETAEELIHIAVQKVFDRCNAVDNACAKDFAGEIRDAAASITHYTASKRTTERIRKAVADAFWGNKREPWN